MEFNSVLRSRNIKKKLSDGTFANYKQYYIPVDRETKQKIEKNNLMKSPVLVKVNEI